MLGAVEDCVSFIVCGCFVFGQMVWLAALWKPSWKTRSVCDGSTTAVLSFCEKSLTPLIFGAAHQDFHSILDDNILFFS